MELPQNKRRPNISDSTAENDKAIAGIEVSEADIVMCHKYPRLECIDPVDCPYVYARCWQYRIWER